MMIYDMINLATTSVKRPTREISLCLFVYYPTSHSHLDRARLTMLAMRASSAAVPFQRRCLLLLRMASCTSHHQRKHRHYQHSSLSISPQLSSSALATIDGQQRSKRSFASKVGIVLFQHQWSGSHSLMVVMKMIHNEDDQ